MSEYDALIKKVERYYNNLPIDGMIVLDRLVNAIRDQASEIERLQSQLVMVKAALSPFAAFADRFGEHAREDDWQLTNNPSGKGNLTMGDVRKARATIRALSDEQHQAETDTDLPTADDVRGILAQTSASREDK